MKGLLGAPQRYGVQRQLRFMRKKLAWQREASVSTPFARRLDMWRRGFRETSYTLYDLEHASADAYLPDSSRLDTFFINSPLARNALNDKLLFSRLLEDHLPLPRVWGLVQSGRFHSLGKGESLLIHAQRAGSLILKPAGGSRGRGIYKLSAGQELSLNSQPTTEDQVHELVAGLDNYLVVEFVEQAAYARTICAQATNTIRILTLVDPDTQDPFVACAVHRFGTPKTAPIDGWSRGGLVSRCDIATGRIGPAVRKAELAQGELRWHQRHPDTGAQLEGVVIPRWEEVCARLLEAVRALPFLTYVGWDVVVTDEGFRVIEGNNNTDIEIQLGGGILEPRVRRFYEYHGIL